MLRYSAFLPVARRSCSFHYQATDFPTECGLTCHTHCAHLVPDFCGMSMEAANQILETLIRNRNTHSKAGSVGGLSNRTLRPGGVPQSLQDSTGPAPPPKQAESPYSSTPKRPSADAVSAAHNSFSTPQSPPPPQQQQQLPIRTSSSNAAAAAAAVATGMRPPSQGQQPPRKCIPKRKLVPFASANYRLL